MILVDTYDKFQLAMEWLNGQETVAYDIETTGLNVRKDRIIGFGVSSGVDGFYVPMLTYDKSLGQLVELGIGEACIRQFLQTLTSKKLLCYNASFDLRFTKNALGVDLLPALHADVMLLKHTCDEEFPFGLKEVGEKIYGSEAVQAQEELKASIKANGGAAKEYFKASTDVIAKYCVADCNLTFRLFRHFGQQLKEQGLEKFFYDDEVMPLYKEVTIPMEEAGIQLDVPLLEQTRAEISADIVRIEQGIQEAITPHLSVFSTWFLNKDYPTIVWTSKKPSAWTKKYQTQHDAWLAENAGYMFNLQSKHHLKKLFFDTLKETPLSRTPTGQPQVNEEFLDSMALKYDWAKRLIEFNKLNKIKSTYINRLIEDQEDGIVYPSYQQHRTVSGRYSSNFQQLPRQVESESGELEAKYINTIRASITARPGNKLVVADFRQIEPRTFCHLSSDENLRNIFLSNKDFYSEIAKMTEGLTEVSKEARQRAKAYALGIPYGMSGYKLKFQINTDDKTADKLVQNYLNAFPKLNEWIKNSKAQAKMLGRVNIEGGRVRHLLQCKELYDKYGSVIDDDLELYKRYHDYPAVYTKAKLDRKIYKNLVNNAVNVQVQGYAATILSRSTIAINRSLAKQGLKAKLVLSIHDELVYDTPEDELNEVCRTIQHFMETTTKLTVPLVAIPVIGDRYSQCK